MQVFTTEDAKVLVPNQEHQNFTSTDEIQKYYKQLKLKNKLMFNHISLIKN